MAVRTTGFAGTPRSRLASFRPSGENHPIEDPTPCAQATSSMPSAAPRTWPVARTARPAGDLGNVLDDVIRDRLALKVAHRPEAAQVIGELTRRSFHGHRISAYQCSGRYWRAVSRFRKAPAFMLPPVPVIRR